MCPDILSNTLSFQQLKCEAARCWVLKNDLRFNLQKTTYLLSLDSLETLENNFRNESLYYIFGNLVPHKFAWGRCLWYHSSQRCQIHSRLQQKWNATQSWRETLGGESDIFLTIQTQLLLFVLFDLRNKWIKKSFFCRVRFSEHYIFLNLLLCRGYACINECSDIFVVK